MVLVVVQLEDPRRVVRLERGVVVREIGQDVRLHRWYLRIRGSRIHWCGDILVQRVLDLVDSLFDLILHFADFFLRLAGETVGLAFALQVVVVGEASDCFLDATFGLIRLVAHAERSFVGGLRAGTV